MDQDRQIRFLIPPFFFFASLLIGVLVRNNALRVWLQAASPQHLLAVGGVITGSLLPVGFLISTITFLLLRVAFLLRRGSFETTLTFAALKATWPHLKTSLPFDQRLTFQAAVTLDHELLSSGMHSWVLRRWSAFLISAQACVGIALAHLVAYFLRLEQLLEWWTLSLSVGLVLLFNAVVCWFGTMKMLEFQAYRIKSITPSETDKVEDR
ncbi:MAG: hypothetical protein ABSG26_10590 [Bryobacteraceae bacterium]|jgi:hypothetical protein